MNTCDGPSILVTQIPYTMVIASFSYVDHGEVKEHAFVCCSEILDTL